MSRMNSYVQRQKWLYTSCLPKTPRPAASKNGNEECHTSSSRERSCAVARKSCYGKNIIIFGFWGFGTQLGWVGFTYLFSGFGETKWRGFNITTIFTTYSSVNDDTSKPIGSHLQPPLPCVYHIIYNQEDNLPQIICTSTLLAVNSFV